MSMSNSHSGNSKANHKALALEVDQLWERMEEVRKKLKSELAYLRSNRKLALTRAYQIFGGLCAIFTIIGCIKELIALLRGEEPKKSSTSGMVFNASLFVGKFAAEEIYRRYNQSQSPRLVSVADDEE